MGCTKASAIEYKNSKVLFKIDLWELALQKLKEVLVPSNPPDDSKNGTGNINMKENGKDGKKGLNSTECCLGKIEKLAIPAKVSLLQSTNIWVSGLGSSVDCTNDRCGGSNICGGSGTSTVGAHSEAMTASSIIDIAGTWCNKFGKEQLKATLKDVRCNPKSNFNLFIIGKAVMECWKLSGNQEGLVLMKGNLKLVFDMKITTKNSVIFCGYLRREYEIAAILASTSTALSIKITRHHDVEQTCRIALELGWIEQRTDDAMQSLLNWESKTISCQQACGWQ